MSRSTSLPRFLPGVSDAAGAVSAPVVARELIVSEADRLRLMRSQERYADSSLTDYFFATRAEDAQVSDVFEHLRWGGQFVFVSRQPRQVEAVYNQFRHRPEFAVECEPACIREPASLFRFGPLRKRHYYFTARKVLLAAPGVHTDRHSYDVRLHRSRDDRPGDQAYVVLKQTPTLEQAAGRLAQRFPDADDETIQRGARKLVNKVFPLFLTREAAFLKILQRELPREYRKRVPEVIHLEKDERGFVSKLYLKWLRLGGQTLPHLEFAKQAADLLRVLHDKVGIIHLDLRLDNFVITEHGVGFVDFGSAVRVGENVEQSAMLAKLLNEMLSNSQIQRDLYRLVRKGTVTSSLFAGAYQKIDRAIDLFYLVLQMNRPHRNPDFRGLVAYDPATEAARHLSQLSRTILQPPDPDHPPIRTAGELLTSILQVEKRLAG